MSKFIIFFITLFYSVSVFAKPLTIILDWFANPNHAPIYVAQEFGFFKKHGVDVNIISPADPSDPMKLVASGNADLGVTYQPSFMLAISRGLPLVRVGTLIPLPLNCIITLKENNIYSVADLKGRAIGYSSGGADNIMLRTMLSANGLSLPQVKLVSFRYGLTQALLAHKVDAIAGSERNFEPIELALAGHPAVTFYPEDNGMPLYDELIIVANHKELNDPRIKNFMLAIQDAVVYLKGHPEETWQMFSKSNPALNNELNKQVWLNTISYFALRPALVDNYRYQRFAEFLHRSGLVQAMPPVSTYTHNPLGE